MNPITIIAMLSALLGVSILVNIIFIKKSTNKEEELNQCGQELAAYDNRCEEQKKALIQYANSINEKDTQIGKLKTALEQYDFKFNEAIRLNNESEQALKDIISEHDKEMREQRERFEKFNATLYTKAEVVDFVKETYKNVKGNSNGVVDYVKEFKANL